MLTLKLLRERKPPPPYLEDIDFILGRIRINHSRVISQSQTDPTQDDPHALYLEEQLQAALDENVQIECQLTDALNYYNWLQSCLEGGHWQGVLPYATNDLLLIPGCKDPDYRNWLDWELKVAGPALQEAGYTRIVFYSGEADSFGPLSRMVRCQKEGLPYRFCYG